MLTNKLKDSLLNSQGTSELSLSCKALRIQEKGYIYLCKSQAAHLISPIRGY